MVCFSGGAEAPGPVCGPAVAAGNLPIKVPLCLHCAYCEWQYGVQLLVCPVCIFSGFFSGFRRALSEIAQCRFPDRPPSRWRPAAAETTEQRVPGPTHPWREASCSSPLHFAEISDYPPGSLAAALQVSSLAPTAGQGLERHTDGGVGRRRPRGIDCNVRRGQATAAAILLAPRFDHVGPCRMAWRSDAVEAF